ncbi:MAG: DUF58 domain-containing protein [Propionibacteriaceae bacterium]
MTQTATREVLDEAPPPRRGMWRRPATAARAVVPEPNSTRRTRRWATSVRATRRWTSDRASDLRTAWLQATAPVRRVVNPLGWLTLVVAVIALVAGLRYGWLEGRGLGTFAVACLAVAALWTFGRMAFAADIELAKSRVTVGESAVGRVVVRNQGGRSLLATRFDLPVGGGVGSFQVPALAADATHEQLFSIPARHRSVLTIGPVRSVKADPLGLMQRVKRWSDPVELFIHPRVVALSATSTGFLRDVDGITTQNLSSSDVAFHALREYVPGDDRRNIHWRTTARMGKLMVRQFEETQRSHLLLVLSTRAADYADPEDFETAVSSVASLAGQALREQRAVTLFIDRGIVTYPSAPGLFDELSRLELSREGKPLRDVAARAVTAVPQTSVAVLVTGSGVSPAELRTAHLQIPYDVKSFAVRCDGSANASRRQIATLVILEVPSVDDLAKALRTVH